MQRNCKSSSKQQPIEPDAAARDLSPLEFNEQSAGRITADRKRWRMRHQAHRRVGSGGSAKGGFGKNGKEPLPVVVSGYGNLDD